VKRQDTQQTVLKLQQVGMPIQSAISTNKQKRTIVTEIELREKELSRMRTNFKHLTDDEVEYRVRINYKSGTSVDAWYNKFKLKIFNGSLSLTTESADDVMFIPIHLNMDEIESIWMVDMRPKTKTKSDT